MTPEERARRLAIAALGWELTARRLARENADLRRRPTWGIAGVGWFAAVVFFAIALVDVFTR